MNERSFVGPGLHDHSRRMICQSLGRHFRAISSCLFVPFGVAICLGGVVGGRSSTMQPGTGNGKQVQVAAEYSENIKLSFNF